MCVSILNIIGITDLILSYNSLYTHIRIYTRADRVEKLKKKKKTISI